MLNLRFKIMNLSPMGNSIATYFEFPFLLKPGYETNDPKLGISDHAEPTAHSLKGD